MFVESEEAELHTIIDDHQNQLICGCLSTEQYFRLKEELDVRMRVGHKIVLIYIFVDLLCKVQ